jgi:hypothetical protein
MQGIVRSFQSIRDLLMENSCYVPGLIITVHPFSTISSSPSFQPKCVNAIESNTATVIASRTQNRLGETSIHWNSRRMLGAKKKDPVEQ